MATIKQQKLTPISEFKSWMGIDNVTPDDVRLAPGYVRVADNADIDVSGMIHRRKGVLRKLISGKWHSGWTDGNICLAVADNDLVMVNTDWSTTLLIEEVGSSHMNFVPVGYKIFFSNFSMVGYILDKVAYGFPSINQTFKTRMMGGDIIEYFDARFYAAQDNIIYFSDAANPMVMDTRKNFITIGGPITMMHAVDDGIYMSAMGKTFFMHGADPFEFRYKGLLDVPAKPGSAIVFDKKTSRGLFAGRTVIFSTSAGIFMGANGGNLIDMTSEHYAVLGVEIGCSFIRWDTKRRHYIFVGEYPDSKGMGSFHMAIPGLKISFKGTIIIQPTSQPSISPSVSPSLSPSRSPSVSPSVSPSASPSAGGSPSVSPSGSPSAAPFVPTDISGCTLWLRSDVGITKNESYLVGTWADQSGNGLDVSQTVDAKKPIWISDGLNGYPILKADQIPPATCDLHRTSVAYTSIFPNSNELSIVLILAETGNVASNYTTGWGGPPTDQVDVLATVNDIIYFDAPYDGGAGRQGIAQPAGWDNQYHILICYRRSDGTQCIRADRVNLLKEGGKTSTVPAITGTLAVFNTFSMDGVFNGNISEVIYYGIGLTDENITDLENYFNDRYGI